MAQWELSHGSNQELLNLSAIIVAEQTAEIKQLGDYLMQYQPASACSPMMAPTDMARFHRYQ